jgi:hypothetical protein
MQALIYDFFFKKHIKPNISAKNKRGQVVDFKYVLVSALRLSDPVHRYLHLKMGLPPELKAGSSGINKDSSNFFLKNFSNISMNKFRLFWVLKNFDLSILFL